MNGVLCAGNKDKTNYVIIQLLLVCHSQIKCQIKERGHSVCLMECKLPVPTADRRERERDEERERERDRERG